MNSCAKVGIFAAPFGLGPSAKAVAIASHLSSRVQTHFFSSEVCARFAFKSGMFHSVETIEFEKPFAATREIAKMDAIISVNTTRFHEHVISQSKPHFFLDTLAWARANPPTLLNDIEAYYIQSFFGHQNNLPPWKNEKVEDVGVVRQCGSREWNPRKSNTLVHLGGLTSPAISDETCKDFVQRTIDLLDCCPGKISLLLPPHFQHVAKTEHISVKSCTVSEINSLLSQTAVSITTPGIEHVYESIICGVPTYLLPPFNSSQVLQTRYFKHELPGMVLHDHVEDFEYVDFEDLVNATRQTHEVALGGTWEKMFNQLKTTIPSVLAPISSTGNCRLRQCQQEAVSLLSLDGALRIARDLEQRIG